MTPPPNQPVYQHSHIHTGLIPAGGYCTIMFATMIMGTCGSVCIFVLLHNPKMNELLVDWI